MQVVKKQVKKRKWSLSNLTTAVHVLLNSYINLYDLLNLPEEQWLRIIQDQSPKDDISLQLEFFPQKRGAKGRMDRYLGSLFRVDEAVPYDSINQSFLTPKFFPCCSFPRYSSGVMAVRRLKYLQKKAGLGKLRSSEILRTVLSLWRRSTLA